MGSLVRRVCHGLVIAYLLCAVLPPAYGAGLDTRPTLRTSHFEVVHSPVDEALAQRTADILETAVVEFNRRLPVGPQPIRVELCHTGQEFRELAGRYGLDRIGGLAQPSRDLIVLKAPALLPQDSDFGGIARHELIHMLLSRNTKEANVPRWFEEGVAMVLSRELRWDSALRLARMYMRRGLIPYPQLDISFAPAGNEEQFGDAYAQALSMTQHLVEHLGEERFWQLVADLKAEPFETALMRHAHWTPGDLYDSWRRTLWKLAVVATLVSGFSVFQLAALLVVLAYWRKRRREKRILGEWEQQEAFERAWGPEGPPAIEEPDAWQEEGDDDDDDEHALR